MDLTPYMEGIGTALGTVGAAGLTAWKAIYANIKNMAKETAEKVVKTAHAAQSAELDGMAARIDRMADIMDEHGMTCRKLESADTQTKINLLENFAAMGQKSQDFREQLRSEFVSKDNVDGRILKALSEHCRNCPRRTP